MRDFAANLERQLAAVDSGISAADASHVVAHADVVAWFRSWDHPDELPMPECG
jgi:predicted transcriptional regulator